MYIIQSNAKTYVSLHKTIALLQPSVTVLWRCDITCWSDYSMFIARSWQPKVTFLAAKTFLISLFFVT